MPLQLSSWPSSGPALNSICRRRLEATRQRTWLPVLYNLFLQVPSIHYEHKRKEGDHVQNSLMLCSSFCDKTRYSTVSFKIRNLVLGLSVGGGVPCLECCRETRGGLDEKFSYLIATVYSLVGPCHCSETTSSCWNRHRTTRTGYPGFHRCLRLASGLS